MPTIAQQLSELLNQRSQLADNLSTKGVPAESSEKFNLLVPKVLEIPSGIDTNDATATPIDIVKDKTAYVKGEKLSGALEIKSEYIALGKTIGTVNGTFTQISDGTEASQSNVLDGKTFFINGQKVTGTMTKTVGTEIIPSTVDQLTEFQTYLQTPYIVKGDANLVSENIKGGIDIFGITGTYKSTGIDTSDATAAPNTVLEGYTAYVNGNKIEGTIKNQETMTITPSKENQKVSSGVYLDGDITVLGDENLSSAYIRKGISIFGVLGTYEGISEQRINTVYDATTQGTTHEYDNVIYTYPEGSNISISDRVYKSLGNFRTGKFANFCNENSSWELSYDSQVFNWQSRIYACSLVPIYIDNNSFIMLTYRAGGSDLSPCKFVHAVRDAEETDIAFAQKIMENAKIDNSYISTDGFQYIATSNREITVLFRPTENVEPGYYYFYWSGYSDNSAPKIRNINVYGPIPTDEVVTVPPTTGDEVE